MIAREAVGTAGIRPEYSDPLILLTITAKII